jgi:hypothetical protein
MFSDILTPLPALGIEFDVIKGKGPLISNPINRCEGCAERRRGWRGRAHQLLAALVALLGLSCRLPFTYKTLPPSFRIKPLSPLFSNAAWRTCALCCRWTTPWPSCPLCTRR